MTRNSTIVVLLSPGFWRYVLEAAVGGLKSLLWGFKDYGRASEAGKRFRLRKDLRLTTAPGLRIGNDVILGHRAILANREVVSGSGRIELEDGVFLGDEVELGVKDGDLLRIGYRTGVNARCVLLGNVRVGAYCTFSYNIYVAAGSHAVDVRPSWLVADQDNLVQSQAVGPPACTRIDDDVWLGWNVFVASGVRIGKGAVVGANCVVSKDVEPYDMVGGVPAKSIRKRLAFVPPRSLDPASDEHFPYYYSGFYLGQDDVRRSRAQGGISARGPFAIVLAHAPGRTVRCQLSVAPELAGKRLQLRANGIALSDISLRAGTQEISFGIPASLPAHPFFTGGMEMEFEGEFSGGQVALGAVTTDAG